MFSLVLRSPNPQLKQQRDRIDMRGLAAGPVIFALVVKVGREAFSDLFASAVSKQVPNPASIL